MRRWVWLAVVSALLAAGCGEESEPPPLEQGVDLELAAEETVRRRLHLAAGEFVRIEVEQRGLDVLARLRDPAGDVIVTADRMIYEDGPELVATVTESAGTHVLELEAWPRPGPPGNLEIRVAVRRQATEDDRVWVEIYGAFLDIEAALGKASFEETIEGYQGTIEGALQVADAELEAEATVRLGEAYLAVGRKKKAADYFAQAAEIPTRDDLWHMWALELLGITRVMLEENDSALPPLQAALTLAERRDHRFRRVMAHLHLGKVFRRRGEIQQALDHFEKAAGLLQPWEKEDRARVLHELGVVQFWNLGQPRLAIERFEQAERIFDELGGGFKDERATTLNQMASAYEALGERGQAIELFKEALELRQVLGERCEEANSSVRLALMREDESTAKKRARLVREILADKKCPSDAAGVRWRLGLFEETAGRKEAAWVEFQKSFDLYSAAGDRAGEARALLGQARVCRQLTDCAADPLVSTRRALEIFEDTRVELVNEEDRIAYGSHTHELFDLLIDLEWERGLHQDAFVSAERARARALHDRLRQAGHASGLERTEPISPAQLNRRLDPSTVLIEYRLGAKKSFVWLVDDTGTASFELAPRSEIEDQAETLRTLLSSPEPIRNAEHWQEAPFRRLADLILPPELVARFADRRLLIVADGVLELIPFAVLPGPRGRPLIDAHEIVHLPSASAWAELSDRPRPPSPAAGYLAVVADPVYTHDDERLGGTPAVFSPDTLSRLKGSGHEAEALLRQVPEGASSLSLLSFNASKAAVVGGQLQDFRYLHFAVHGKVNPLQPALSYLAFSRFDTLGREIRGNLFAHEIYGLDLPAELVVLAACDTGIGKLTPGEGLVSGLARGFLFAGARRVVVSLWQISDQATPELMTRFYALLRTTGDPVRSLQRVQRELYLEGHHPYEWAGFVIQGV